jgi:murein DD-endopeptidase MepM/ murein hydrolase activator NlpD
MNRLFFSVLLSLVMFFSAYSQFAYDFRFPVGDKDGNGWLNNVNGVNFLQVYGYGCGDVFHPGFDFNKDNISGDGDLGQPVYAVADGEVVFSNHLTTSWGNIVMIKHYLPEGGIVFSFYGHLNERYVAAGARVKIGDNVGTVGNNVGITGQAHLHFEIRKENMAGYAASYFPCGQNYDFVASHYYSPKAFISARKGKMPIAYNYDLTKYEQKGWTYGWDAGFLLGTNSSTGYGMDEGAWFVNITGPNPGIVSPEFDQVLKSKSTIMEFSAKVYADVDPTYVCTLWVKDEYGSWNNPIKPELVNSVYGYNNGQFKNRDYNVYRVNFENIRAPQYLQQYGELIVKQFSL